MKQILILACLFVQLSFAQTNIEDYYTQFDTSVNSYLSDLNTGERFVDIYPTISEDEFRFFKLSNSSIGTVTYNNQTYYKRYLKYDLLEDNLLLYCDFGSNGYDIILDKSLVEAFSIFGKEFTKLPIEASSFSFYNNGYFEIISSNDVFGLYAKYEKSKNEKLGNKKIYYKYSLNERILFRYDSVFYEINSKGDIIRILGDKKSDIKSFYKKYSQLEKNNKADFYKKLFGTIFKNN